MPYYNICVVGGDGSGLSRERHLATDVEAVWDLVFRVAERKRGRRIHVLDEQGGLIIGIGVNTATRLSEQTRVVRRRSG